MPQVLVDFNRNNSTDLVWDETTEQYIPVVVPPTKPEHLYAYTDPNGEAIPLYGWTESSTSYYTKFETPEVGMHLYDITGTDTGEVIGVVNQDGSWEIYVAPTGVSVDFEIGTDITDYIIDGVTYTTNQTLSLSEGSHTLVVNGTNTQLLINGDYSEYSFPASLTFNVSSSVISFPRAQSATPIDINVGTTVEFVGSNDPI